MESLGILVRPATTEDANRMMQIQLRCLDEVYPSVYTKAELDSWKSKLTVQAYMNKVQSTGWCYCAVAEEGRKETVVGYGYINIDSYEPPLIPVCYQCVLQIESLYVDPTYHRRSIGRQLLQVMEGKAKAEGCTRVGVASSLYAVTFYESTGYTTVEDHHYCAAVDLAVNIMVKEL